MAAAATLSFGVISTICSLFGADSELGRDLDNQMPTARQSRFASAAPSLPVEVRPLMQIQAFDLGGIRLVCIENPDELRHYLAPGSTLEVGARIAGTVLEGNLNAGISSSKSENHEAGQGLICRVQDLNDRRERPRIVPGIPLPNITLHALKLPLPGKMSRRAWRRIHVGDAALLGTTIDQIRRQLDTHTIDVVTGRKAAAPCPTIPLEDL